MRITWFGHSAFRLDFSDKVVLIDPFFTGNPAFDGDRAKAVDGVTHIIITHGHGDHIGDAVEISKRARGQGHHQLRPVHVARLQGPGELRSDEHRRHDGPGRLHRHAR